MHTRERILTIRLLEKVKEHPAYAKALGIEVKKEKLISQAGPIHDPLECAANKM